MNIQPSLMVWTAICFLLTALILHNWLFRPVLKLLDRRRAALEAARAKKAGLERSRLSRAEARKAKLAEYRDKRRQEMQAEASRLEEDSKARLKSRQDECLRNINAYRDRLQDDYASIIGKASRQMNDAAKIIAEKITSDRT